MSADDKVIWSEGMFIRAQHFQQEARYLENLIRQRSAGVRPYAWGLTEAEIDRQLLTTGRFAMSHCAGIFEDGTSFTLGGDNAPPPLALPEGTRDTVVYLTVPVRRPGSLECSSAADSETVARYRPVEFDVQDSNEAGTALAPIQVGTLRLRYQLGTADLAGFMCLALARIVEVRADRSVALDERHMAPVLDCAVSPALAGFLNEVTGLLHHRGDALSGRVSGAARGVAELSDFLLLQAINRTEPLFSYFASGTDIHPETVYAAAISLVGELHTFTAAGRRPPELPPYRHDDLQRSFGPILDALRQSLSAVLEQSAVPIPLTEHKYGIHVGTIADRGLIGSAAFVLAAKAAMPTDRLLRTLPSQIKIGSVEQIRELVNAALPGIRINPLPVVPRQIPYHTGVVYFELDRTSPLWRNLTNSGAIALHIAGEFPELELEFWAIKD